LRWFVSTWQKYDVLSHSYGFPWQRFISESARQVASGHAHKFSNNWFPRVANDTFNFLAEMLLVRNWSLFIELSNTPFSSDEIQFMIDDLCTS
jgi:hypothetical protein